MQFVIGRWRAIPRHLRAFCACCAWWAFFCGDLNDGAGLRYPVVHAAEADPWLGRDKALHFSFSAAIATGGYGAAALVTDQRSWRLLGGLTSGLAAGIGKEALDAAGSGDASWRDFTWDVIGTATGLGVASLIDWLISR